LRARLSLLERSVRDSIESRGVRLDLGGAPVADLRALPPEPSSAYAGREAPLGAALREGTLSLLDRHLSEVATDLGSADVGTRSRAIASLGSSRSKLAADYLLPMLSDVDSEVRLRTLEALRDCGDERAADAVRSLLDDSVAAVRERASGVLARLREEPLDGSGDQGESKPLSSRRRAAWMSTTDSRSRRAEPAAERRRPRRNGGLLPRAVVSENRLEPRLRREEEGEAPGRGCLSRPDSGG